MTKRAQKGTTPVVVEVKGGPHSCIDITASRCAQETRGRLSGPGGIALSQTATRRC